MASAISSILVHCAFDGCLASISIHDTVIEKRPYHKNCKCALHKQKGNCSHIWSTQRNVSFPKKTIGGSLTMTVSSNNSIHSHPSSAHVASESSGGSEENWAERIEGK
ncbi:unnamed protein product [Linum trigynum]|uniref:SWIM-type domain-containing protein n=1 Tax=Linum trigynum TaxID=586398 RepID=A0AAV2GWV4_9ROSI